MKQTITNYDLPDASRISKEIPDDVKIAIAGAIIAFAAMENSAEEVIWDLTGLSADDGKLLTKRSDKLDLAKRLSERYRIPIHGNSQTTIDIWSIVSQLVDARNKIAHGVWIMIDGKMPSAVSWRIPAGAGRIMSEHFPITRLELIAANCWKIKDLLDAMARHIASLPEKPAAQPEPAVSYPELPPASYDV
jgi:hypothetical protein